MRECPKVPVTILGLTMTLVLSLAGQALGQLSGSLPLRPAASTAPLHETPDGGVTGRFSEDPKSTPLSLNGSIQATPGLVPVVEATDYLLGPGDGLALNIWGSVQAVYPLTIFGDGKIIIPSVGSLYVNGLTLAEAQLLVADAVRRYYRDAKTGLTLTGLRSFEVQVIGQVKRPGVYQATSANRILDLIAKAGGLTEYGSIRHLDLYRHGKKRVLDLVEFQLRGATEHNPHVVQGDVLLVPPKGSMLVTVKTSAVRVHQGGPLTESPSRTIVELQDGERLSDLLAMIGGIDPWWDSDKSFIERRDDEAGHIVIPVNPYRLVVLKENSHDVALRNGDALTIPLVENRVYVLGEVKSSGPYAFVPDRRALDYIVLAGGGTQRANFSEAYVQKRNGSSFSLEQDPVVEVGDTIIVPEVGVRWWQDYVSVGGFLMGLSGFVFLLLAL